MPINRRLAENNTSILQNFKVERRSKSRKTDFYEDTLQRNPSPHQFARVAFDVAFQLFKVLAEWPEMKDSSALTERAVWDFITTTPLPPCSAVCVFVCAQALGKWDAKENFLNAIAHKYFLLLFHSGK